MAKKRIPDPLTRRHLIEKELPPAQALAIAEAYLEDGRSDEAVGFLGKAGAVERLDALRAEAVSTGDVFLFRAVLGALEASADRDEWQRLGETASSLGKQRYADEASRQAERGED